MKYANLSSEAGFIMVYGQQGTWSQFNPGDDKKSVLELKFTYFSILTVLLTAVSYTSPQTSLQSSLPKQCADVSTFEQECTTF